MIINLQGNSEKQISWWANAIISESKGSALPTLKFTDGVISQSFIFMLSQVTCSASCIILDFTFLTLLDALYVTEYHLMWSHKLFSYVFLNHKYVPEQCVLRCVDEADCKHFSSAKVKDCVELHLHSPLYLHGMLLNWAQRQMCSHLHSISWH